MHGLKGQRVHYEFYAENGERAKETLDTVSVSHSWFYTDLTKSHPVTRCASQED